MKITTVGIDLAKNVFAIHGVGESGQVVLKRTLRRHQFLPFFAKLPPCLIGMEACGSSHYWARELRRLGHEVRLMPPGYVKAYIKRGKSDGIDAEGCCEAVGRPTMRFVPVKSEAQQAVLALHRARNTLVEQRTKTANVLRSLCAEFGVIAAKGKNGLTELMGIIGDETAQQLPSAARIALRRLVAQWQHLDRDVAALEQEIVRSVRSDDACRRLTTIPGVGPITASALVATIGDAGRFKSGRHLAAWIGLTRRANATGGRDKNGPISKQGDRHLRRLFVNGAATVVKSAAKPCSRATTPWLRQLLQRKNRKLAMVAQANKTARIAWAVLARGEPYRAPVTGVAA